MEKVKILKCKEKQEIKYFLEIELESKIASKQEFNDILTIMDNGLLVECFKILKRYMTCAIIEVSSDECSAIINIKGNLINISSLHHGFCAEIHDRIVEILELEVD
jgi:hypothetical protein